MERGRSRFSCKKDITSSATMKFSRCNFTNKIESTSITNIERCGSCPVLYWTEDFLDRNAHESQKENDGKLFRKPNFFY